MTALQDMVRALRSVTKAEAVALINRDGSILATDLPGGISRETFSIMCAAILGAGMTAATELHHAAPHRVLLESDDITMLISAVGRRAMLVVAVAPERSVSEILAVVERFAKAAVRDLD
jgi:predicted regulator of Ras-like GTPase activity (Roadblock/LC7/MglB family)